MARPEPESRTTVGSSPRCDGGLWMGTLGTDLKEPDEDCAFRCHKITRLFNGQAHIHSLIPATALSSRNSWVLGAGGASADSELALIALTINMHVSNWTSCPVLPYHFTATSDIMSSHNINK